MADYDWFGPSQEDIEARRVERKKRNDYLEFLKSRNFMEIDKGLKIFACLLCGVLVWGMDLHRIDCTSAKAKERAVNIPPRCHCGRLQFEGEPHTHA